MFDTVPFEKATTLEEMLRAHDWTYDYSDDSRAWYRGNDQRTKIVRTMNEEARKSPERKAEVIALWHKHCPKQNDVPMFNCPIS